VPFLYQRKTAGPSTTLRFGRDDRYKGERHALPLYSKLLLLYFEALSALPLRNISLTVATKWCADAGVGTAPLKMVL
jgi:hypothetical protein